MARFENGGTYWVMHCGTNLVLGPQGGSQVGGVPGLWNAGQSDGRSTIWTLQSAWDNNKTIYKFVNVATEQAMLAANNSGSGEVVWNLLQDPEWVEDFPPRTQCYRIQGVESGLFLDVVDSRGRVELGADVAWPNARFMLIPTTPGPPPS